MKYFFSRLIGLLFLVSSVLASESSSKQLNSHLRHAAGSGNIAKCKQLLSQGAALEGRGQGGVTPLFVASQDGRAEIVKFLLCNKAQINAKCDTGATPLYVACQNGHSEVAQLLLESKALINAMSEGSVTPLFIASQKGHREVARLLLRGKADVNEAMSDGTTPLFMASQNGYYELVKLLIGGKALVNSALDTGTTPLFMASQNDHSEVVKLLLEGKAQVDYLRNDGTGPLSIAKQQGHIKVISLLLQSKSQSDNVKVSLTREVNSKELDSQLRHAAGFGNVAACKQLLGQGAALDGRGQKGLTPLYVASQKNHEEVVKVLLKSKAQVDAAGDDGATSLYIASQKGHVEVVQLLLESKAKVNAARVTGATPVFIASQNGHSEIVQLLLGSNAQVNARKNDGMKPLHVACLNGHSEVVQLLLRSKALVNIMNEGSVTPLSMASKNGHSEICQLLLDRKAALTTQTKKNKGTALHAAVSHSRLDCATVLLNAKADVMALDEQGKTPLVYAADQRNGKLCILLSKYGAEIKVSRWSLNKGHKKLAKYVQSVLTSNEGKISSTDSNYQSIDHLLSSDQGASHYSAVPSGEPLYSANDLSTLHKIAQEGDCGKLEMIFGFGVPVDQLNDEGYTALHLAVLGGHYEMCSQLLEYGADKNIETPEGETAPQIAQKVGHTDIVGLLKKIHEPEQEAISSTDKDYQTFNRLVCAIKGVPKSPAVLSGEQKEYEKIFSTLHKAAQVGDCAELEMIFGFGVPVDSLNTDGYTALHLAVLGGHFKMCSQLLNYGADKNIETPEGETALQIAQRIGNKKLIELLDLKSDEV